MKDLMVWIDRYMLVITIVTTMVVVVVVREVEV
jgi:hypothetical protein